MKARANSKSRQVILLLKLGYSRKQIAEELNTTDIFVRAIISRYGQANCKIEYKPRVRNIHDIEGGLRATEETNSRFLRLLKAEAARCQA